MFAGDGSCRCGVKGSQRIVGGEEADVSLGQDGNDDDAYFHTCVYLYLHTFILVYTCAYLWYVKRPMWLVGKMTMMMMLSKCQNDQYNVYDDVVEDNYDYDDDDDDNITGWWVAVDRGAQLWKSRRPSNCLRSEINITCDFHNMILSHYHCHNFVIKITIAVILSHNYHHTLVIVINIPDDSNNMTITPGHWWVSARGLWRNSCCR